LGIGIVEFSQNKFKTNQKKKKVWEEDCYCCKREGSHQLSVIHAYLDVCKTFFGISSSLAYLSLLHMFSIPFSLIYIKLVAPLL
jgi:hypothetical protein